MISIKSSFISFALKAVFVFILCAGTIVIIGGVLYSTIDKLATDVRSDKTYSVQGKAKRKVALDSADLNLGVLITGPTAVEVQKQAGEKYNKAIKEIKALGIKEDNIQTQGYSVQPVYKPTTNDIEKYQIDLTLMVKLEGVKPESDLVGKVINVAADAGFNKVNNLNFYLDDYDKIVDEIKGEAIEDAKRRAKQEAELADFDLGKVLNVYFNDNYPMYNTRNAYAEADMAPGSSMMDLKEAAPAVMVNPGSTEVTTNVTIVYELET